MAASGFGCSAAGAGVAFSGCAAGCVAGSIADAGPGCSFCSGCSGVSTAGGFGVCAGAYSGFDSGVGWSFSWATTADSSKRIVAMTRPFI
ncbi:MAG: hypothetical protein JXA30_04080 [Deltaproteobacteria bacterium]|nr:hypothetical protein [Deltaproteobacteria bacterium]